MFSRYSMAVNEQKKNKISDGIAELVKKHKSHWKGWTNAVKIVFFMLRSYLILTISGSYNLKNSINSVLIT